MIKTLPAVVACFVLILSSCAGTGAARRAALKLQAQAGLYQSQLDAAIAQQQTFYDARQQSIEAERKSERPFAVDQLRDERALEAASKMAVDPNRNARLHAITEYLIANNQEEHNLHVALYQKQIETRQEMEAMIQKLKRKRDALQKVKSDLAELSSRKTSAGHARAVLAVAEQTITALQP